MRSRALCLSMSACAALLMAWPAGFGGAPPLTEDPPVATMPAAGDLTGRIAPADQVARLWGLCRATGKIYSPASFDRAEGRFVFRNLPGDAAYDICIETADGRRIEGIDLDFCEARLLRLAELRRRELGIPPEREHAFGQDDVRELLGFVRDIKDFMELRRVLYLSGQGRRATMLVELMRTRDFHADKGDVIWRVELWYFVNQFGGWERLANQERVLRRERLPPGDWKRIDVSYYPQLSARVSPEGQAEPVAFTIPPCTDPSRGRPAGTEPELRTEPHVLGLPARPTSTTAPAAPGNGD